MCFCVVVVVIVVAFCVIAQFYFIDSPFEGKPVDYLLSLNGHTLVLLVH